MATLSSIKQQFNTRTGAASLLTENQIQTAATRREEEEEAKKNNGGFFGGIGYALEKIGLGFLSGIEGIWDYTAGGLAKLFGADDWAEQQFANDWVDYNHADEWYNPSDGWKVVGDVAGGIGTSLPAIAGVAAAGAITVASGGTLSPVAAGLISASIAGLGAAGRATKEAYDQTGELGGKEFGYGALVGITEGTVEGLSAGIGAGTGAVIKNITKSFGKEVAKSTARQTFTKTIFKSFAGEAFEEGLSEMLTPVWKRLTYDPNAKNATFQEIGYAALVGGLSGAIMGGFDVSVRNVGSYTRGNTIVNQSKADGVLSTAQQISEYETNNHTGYESFEAVQSLYNELQNSLTKTNGQVSTARQKMLIGMLERANTSATFTPFVARSAENIVNNAELIAQRLSSYGYTDANGNPITVTAEQIRNGIDLTSKSKRKINKSFSKALKNNDILRTLAVADATGQLTMDTARFRESALMGERLSSQADLNRFIETATDSELRAVSERLGIEDWQTITNEEFQNKITEFVENGGVETYRQESLIIKEAQNISPESAQRLGRVVRLTQDGTYRFRSANADIAIVKNGDSYRIFDYESGRLSNELTRAELNRVIREINNQNEQSATAVKEQLEQRERQENKYKIQAQEIDAFARENIKDYAKLNESNKSMVRAVIRQARASGIAEADVLSYARVSAHSGLNIVFSKHLSFVAADGSFADGAIDLKNNRIIINPEAKNRTSEMILIHELTHAIYNKNGVLQVAEGLNYMTDTEKERIRQRYSKIGQGNSIQISDEINAHFAEQTLSNKNILERLVADKPTIKDKVLVFFKKSTTDYSEDSKLTGAAKKLYKQYKKLFDDFVAHNQGRNAAETSYVIESNKKLALQKQESISNEISKPASIDNYTESQYNKFGWIRVNNALTKNQWNDFNRKFASAKNKTNMFNKTVNGEQIIPVNDMVGESFGVDNVLVFAKGTYQNPTITKIIKINLTDETSIDYVRRYIYERESNINNTQGNLAQDYFGEELIREVRQRDFPSYQEHKDNKRAQRGRDDSSKDIESNKSNQQRRRDNSGSKNNIKYALPETDSDGNVLTDKQREYFADSKIVDSKGRLLVAYHGTDANFNTFRNKPAQYGRAITDGYYFTLRKSNAAKYGKNVKEVYLNIVNPFYLHDGDGVVAELAKRDYTISRLVNEFGVETDDVGLPTTKALRKFLKKLGYDGVVSETIGENNIDTSYSETQIVAFDANQIKNIDNKQPTRNNDIRYALTDSRGKKLSEQQAEFFKDSQIRAIKVDGWDTISPDGRLFEVYHGTDSGEFYVFDKNTIGSANDMGWYGKGFYFAFSESEARTYGSRVLKCYLNIKKPFIFDEQMQSFDGVDDGDIYFDFASFVINIADKFPNLAKKLKVDIVSEYNSQGVGKSKRVDFSELSKEIKEIYNNNRLQVAAIQDGENTYWSYKFKNNIDNLNIAPELRDVIEKNYIRNAFGAKISFQNNHITEEQYNKILDLFEKYGEQDFETVFLSGRYYSKSDAIKGRLSAAIDYLSSHRYRYIEQHIPEHFMQYIGDEFNAELKKQEYDGVIQSTKGDEIVAFYENQIKLSSNKNPTDSNDIRFALQNSENEDSRAIGGLSRGQRAKFVANNTRLKVYSKAEAAEVINSIIDERLVLEDKYGSLSGKSKAEVVDMLFRQLNSAKDGYRGTVALNIADYLIENTVLNDMYVYDNADAMTELTILRSYMHKVDLKSIWGEVQHKFDDKRSSIALVWGAKEGGMAPDVIAQELNDRGIRIEAINEADCFFEMIEKYDSLRKDVNQKAKEVMLRDYGSEEQIETLRQQIAKDILLAYDQKGTQSKYGRLVEKYTAQIESLRRQVKETRQQNILMNNIADRAQKLKDLKLGTFLNATQYKNDIFKNSIERLANIKYRGNFNATGTRRIMSELRQWYTKDNPVLSDNFNEDIAYMIDSLSQGNNNYSTEELGMLRNVMSYFINFVENYNKVYRQGKWIDAIPEAERYIEVLHRNKDVKLGIFNRLTSSTYYQTFGDPMAVARRMDMYENGFYTEMMSELRDAAVDAEIAEMEVKTPYKNFLDTHKKYLKEIENTLVTYQGVEIPKAHLISLYMTLKREQAQAGLAQNGFSFIDNKRRKVRVNGFAPNVTTDAELLTSVVEEQTKIDKLLSNTDREYIAILESGYNQDAKKLKAERDMQRLGFTNATEDYYYPIRRGNIARNIDTSDIASELDRVSNASFNKDTVRGAKQELYIESADVVYNRHIKAVTKYAYLSPAIENYNRLYNVDISGNRNKPVSVATESANTWDRGNKYFSKLISDIQGIPSSSSEGMKLLGFIRGSYAKFQLGANPKTWVTQLSSLFASTSILDTNSVIRGLTISGKDVDTYCSLAKLRNADNTAAMAQGLLDKVGKVSNALMAPIGKMDRFVIRKLFGACQVQVEKNGGAKVGTVANKTEAGKLLRRVILETQQNSIVTERSAAMRSGNEVLRTITMFSADSMKAMARLVDSVGELTTLRAKLKATTDVELQNTLRKQIKTAQRKLRKSAMAMASTAAFMVGVAQLFNWLYNKDNDDDEDKAQALVVDFVGNLFGGLPLIRDIYTKFTEGYDIDSYSYSALNDLLNSAVDIFDLVENLVSGNSSSQEIASSIKKLSYAIGQAFGFPVRNIYNVLYGLTKRISPATAYKIDNTFYNKSYISDLNTAIENDDAEMITTIMSILLNERIGGEISDKVIERLNHLYSLGYSVLPRTVGTSLAYNGESFAITSAQRESFKKIYSQANKYIESMITDRSFSKLTEEQQAKAIKQVYDAYYSKALSDTLNVDAETNLYKYSQYIPINKLSIALTGISGIESDKTLQGTTISGSKKKKVIIYLLGQNLTDEQRLLILLLQGYTIQDREYKNYTEEQVKNKLLKYILAMKITQSEKADLLSKIGYEVKNGRVIINSK